MMNKIINGLVHLNIHKCLLFSKETRTLNTYAYKFQTPFSSKNALKYAFFPRTREWNKLPAEVVLSLSLAEFKEKATTLWTKIQSRLVNNIYFFNMYFIQQLVWCLTGFTNLVKVKVTILAR